MRRRLLAGFVAVLGLAALAVTGEASPSTAAAHPATIAAAQPAAFTCVQSPLLPADWCRVLCPRCAVAGSVSASTAEPAAPAINCVNSPLIPIDPCRVICPHCLSAAAVHPTTATTAAAPRAAPASPGYVCNIFSVLNGTCKPAVCYPGQVCPMVDLTPTSAVTPATAVRLGS